jgi:hypothetical protein
MASIDWGLIQGSCKKWLPIAIKANNHDLLGYVLGVPSDNDIIEGYQIACSCGNIRMLRRLVEAELVEVPVDLVDNANCPDIIDKRFKAVTNKSVNHSHDAFLRHILAVTDRCFGRH